MLLGSTRLLAGQHVAARGLPACLWSARGCKGSALLLLGSALFAPWSAGRGLALAWPAVQAHHTLLTLSMAGDTARPPSLSQIGVKTPPRLTTGSTPRVEPPGVLPGSQGRSPPPSPQHCVRSVNTARRVGEHSEFTVLEQPARTIIEQL